MTDSEMFSRISSEIMALSAELKNAGQPTGGEALVEAAAKVELLSPDLQNCWGGPFNGQRGREAIAQELIDKLRFDAIIETGTYRGITTEWFAQHFTGPIESCEINRLYYLQAAHRLNGYPHVTLTLADSRDFLREKVRRLAKGSRVLFYLDAHWEEALPLVDELRIILGGQLDVVVMIDDFKVPFDDGYAFDDYGPGKALKLELLDFLKNSRVRLFFPQLPSSEETGAGRGVCVLSERLADDVAACMLLRGSDWRDWKLEELEHALAKMSALEGQMKDFVDRIGQKVEALAENVQALHAEAQSRQGEVESKLDRLLAQLVDQRAKSADIEARQDHSAAKLDQIVALAEEWRELLRVLVEEAAEPQQDETERALVEERTKNLELQRQVQRLEERCAWSGGSSDLAAAESSLASAHEAVQSLLQSRALGALSLLATGPRGTVLRAKKEMDRAIAALDLSKNPVVT